MEELFRTFIHSYIEGSPERACVDGPRCMAQGKPTSNGLMELRKKRSEGPSSASISVRNVRTHECKKLLFPLLEGSGLTGFVQSVIDVRM